MKKILFFIASLIMLVSCTKSGFDYNPSELKEQQYNAAFEKRYGKIAEKHDWGFGVASTTRSAYPNSNMWESDGYVVPGAITADEVTAVKAVFDQVGEQSYTALVDWDCFFVQQVWKGTASYTAGNGGTVVGGNQMDWLCAYDPVGKTEIIYPDWNNWQATEVTNHDDHVNNFNNANGSIQLMINSSTQRFGFKSSTDNGHVFYNFRMEKINGSYYVGFDFEAAGQNPNEQVARDYIYNDWIVKIVPGKGTSEIPYTKRIICEDLGTTDDFDFNDVVFDAYIGGGKTYIKLLAAGGTLPLSVAGVDVHDAFGVDDNVMVNTNNGTVSKSPVEFTLDFEYDSYNDIPVVVQDNRNANAYVTYELKTSIGSAPQKIAVGTDFDWCDERVSIEVKYPAFRTYVSDPSLSNWWK